MKKILIVDDEKDIVYSIISGLKVLTSDLEFIEANSGEEALEKMSKEKMDLVLLDIMMPGLDGWEVSAKIKGNPKTRKIPIIFLTAKTDDFSKGMGSLHAEYYITKPFTIDNLYSKIKNVLSGNDFVNYHSKHRI